MLVVALVGLRMLVLKDYGAVEVRVSHEHHR